MKHRKRLKSHKGFSLIELLIVILIISVVYFLGFGGFELGKPKPKPLTIINLKNNITNSELFDRQATLLCLDKCKTCYIRKDFFSPFEKYANAIDLHDIKAYTIDTNDELARIEYGRYKDKRICLVMNFYRNGSSTPLILENQEGSYLLSSLFSEAMQFDDPEDAKEYWAKKNHALSDHGEFY